MANQAEPARHEQMVLETVGTDTIFVHALVKNERLRPPLLHWDTRGVPGAVTVSWGGERPSS